MVAEINGLNEECGIFGIFNHPEAAKLTYYGLHSLQHRGQEAAGMVISNGSSLTPIKGAGLVTEVFNEENLEQLVGGNSAIGHVRYSGVNLPGLEHIEPLYFQSTQGSIALAHNGHIANAETLKEKLEKEGSIFHTTSNIEVLAHLTKKDSKKQFTDRLLYALAELDGAFALVLLVENKLYAALDPKGVRPLSLGKIDDSYVIASETCAFDVIGAEYVREIEPGELVEIDETGIHSYRFSKTLKRSLCAMEYIYFARPDSNLNDENVHSIRKRLGKRLAEIAPVEADVVTGVPDSSISAAIGFAEASGIPYELGLIKNRYVSRTFIKPTQSLREHGVQLKLSALRKIVAGKRVVMVDDSIVRGTTSKRIVKLLKEAGAKEVHVRITAPPIKHPCQYGVDMKTESELISAGRTVEEVRELIGADSLHFLPTENLVETIVNDSTKASLCLSCFTGKYVSESI